MSFIAVLKLNLKNSLKFKAFHSEKTLKCILLIHLHSTCVLRHCVRECRPVNVPSKCAYAISLLLTDNKSALTFQSVHSCFPYLFFGQTSLHLCYGLEGREITQVHLLEALTGMHSRTQCCITNEKSLGPFRPVSARGPGCLGRALPAGRQARCYL